MGSLGMAMGMFIAPNTGVPVSLPMGAVTVPFMTVGLNTLVAGTANYPVALPGVLATDQIEVMPIGNLPLGFILNGYAVTADNVIQLNITNPLLPINTSLSLNFAVSVIR